MTTLEKTKKSDLIGIVAKQADLIELYEQHIKILETRVNVLSQLKKAQSEKIDILQQMVDLYKKDVA